MSSLLPIPNRQSSQLRVASDDLSHADCDSFQRKRFSDGLVRRPNFKEEYCSKEIGYHVASVD